VQKTRNKRRQRQQAPSSGASVIAEAARRWGVPLWVLVGVKLMETGNDLSAANPFQFEPGTARSAGVKDVNNLHESANGAARLLASYHRKYGSWNAAFEAYNGGEGAVGGGYAYTAKDVKAKLHEFGGDELTSTRKFASFGGDVLGLLGEIFKPGAPGQPGGDTGGLELGKKAEGAAGSTIGGIGSALGSVGDFFAILTDGQTWIRILETLAGAILLYIGLRSLTGVGATDVPGVKTARSLARV
jgi:hypothetical protein